MWIVYTALYAVNNKAIESSAGKNASSPKAEKLAASQVSLEKQVVEQISPRPFVNDLRGASPAGFFPQFQATTASYPQMSNHRAQAHPNNIQDIIQYLSENAHRQKELIREEQNFATTNRERDKFQLFGTIRGSRPPYKQIQENHNQFGFRQHLSEDPFFAYKPQDPSDINLLAPSSFRFAPPILSSGFYRNRQQLIQEAVNVANAVNVTSGEGLRKPLSLTLHIYPFDNQFGNGIRNRFQGPGLTPRYRYPFAGSQRAENVVAPGRMVVHLNVYPGHGTAFDTGEESNERKFQTRRNFH